MFVFTQWVIFLAIQVLFLHGQGRGMGVRSPCACNMASRFWTGMALYGKTNCVRMGPARKEESEG
jgi:hypothetical protein